MATGRDHPRELGIRERAYQARHRIVGLTVLAVAVVGILVSVGDAIASEACVTLAESYLILCSPPPTVLGYLGWVLAGVGGTLLAVFWPPSAKTPRD